MISFAFVILIASAMLFARWAVRRARRRVILSDPFVYPYGEVTPLPAGSLIELHSHSARLASRADQGSGGDGNILSGAAAARLSEGGERRAY